MLDILFNAKKAKDHPLEFSIIAIFYSSLSVIVGLWLFSRDTSTAIIFLSTISCLYVLQGALRREEKKEKNYNSEIWTLKQHKPLFVLILFLFFGFVISFSLFAFFLPSSTSSQVFELQKLSLEHIQSITGDATNLSGSLPIILKNNFSIVLISLVFAFFFGAGAVYIIVWNASVMGFVIGSLARESFGFVALPFVALKFFLHGIPEMLAYIIASVAGGILYFAFIRGDLMNHARNKRIIIDVISLIVISFVLLVVSGLIEVFISPII